MPMVSYVSGVAIGAGSNSMALGSVANNTSSSTPSTAVPPTVNSGEPIGGGGVIIHLYDPLSITQYSSKVDRKFRGARKPVFGGLRTTQAQTSLRICAV